MESHKGINMPKGIKAVWAVTAIVIAILLFSFVGSLTWLFTSDVILLFRFLVILFTTISLLILL